MLLAKTKLDTIEVLISKALNNSYISHDEFVSVNNVLREYNEMKEETKKPQILWNVLCKKRWKSIVRKSCKRKFSCQKN